MSQDQRREAEPFDHTVCPSCGATMRLKGIVPRLMSRHDGYERHLYGCEACGNESRFVFEHAAGIPAHLAARSAA